MSAIFDVILILLLLFAFNVGDVLFRTALFIEIVLSEVLVLFMIRTDKVFLKSTPPSKKLVLASAIALFITFALFYLPITSIFEFTSLPLLLLGVIILVTVGYIIVTEIVKLAYFKKLTKPHATPMVKAQLAKILESQREFLETLDEDHPS